MAKATPKTVSEKFTTFFAINLIIRLRGSNEDIPASDYAKIFREFYLSFIRGKSSESKACILVTNAEQKLLKNNLPMFYGTFVEYTNIDSRKWFNVVSRTPDTEFSVPENLKANYKQATYFFFPDIHRFCYMHSAKESISPINVEEYLRNGFHDFLNNNYEGKYYSQINFEKAEQTVKEILNADEVYSLEIRVTYPNGDFADKAKKFVGDDMKKSNINTLYLEASNSNKQPIDVKKSEVIVGAIENSVSNGYVSASIKTNGKKRKKVTTLEHPAKIPVPSNFAKPEFIKEIYNFFKALFI